MWLDITSSLSIVSSSDFLVVFSLEHSVETYSV